MVNMKLSEDDFIPSEEWLGEYMGQQGLRYALNKTPKEIETEGKGIVSSPPLPPPALNPFGTPYGNSILNPIEISVQLLKFELLQKCLQNECRHLWMWLFQLRNDKTLAFKNTSPLESCLYDWSEPSLDAS